MSENIGGGLAFQATLNIDDFKVSADAMERRIRNVSTTAVQESEKMEQSIAAFAQNGARYIIGTLVGGGMMGLVNSIVQTRGQFQQLQIAFDTMLGSGAKSKALMDQLTNTAARTPFDLMGVAGGAKQLLAYGESANKVNDTLVRLGNIASGLSIPLNDIVYLYGTTMVQGRLYAQDVRQFTGRGIPLVRELAAMYGKTAEEINAMVSEGKIGFPEVEKVINKMTNSGGQFYNLMERQSKSLTGMISNLGDSWDMALNKLGEDNQGALESGISGAITVVEHLDDVLRIVKAIAIAYGSYRAAIVLNTLATKGYTGVSLIDNTVRQAKIALMKADEAATGKTAAITAKMTAAQEAHTASLQKQLTVEEQANLAKQLRIATIEQLLTAQQQEYLSNLNVTTSSANYEAVAMGVLSVEQREALSKTDLSAKSAIYQVALEKEVLAKNQSTAATMAAMRENVKAAAVKMETAKLSAVSSMQAVESARYELYWAKQSGDVTRITTAEKKLEGAVENQAIARKTALAASSDFYTKKKLLETTATRQSTVASAADTTTKEAQTVATSLLDAATTKLSLGLKALWATMKANPIGWIVSILGIAYSAYEMFFKKQEDGTETITGLAKATKDVTEEFGKQAAKVDTLKKIINDGNIAYFERNKALNELKQIIPGYNAELTKEGKIINDNTDAIEKYLTQLEKQIKLKAAQDELEQAYKQKRTLEKTESSQSDKYWDVRQTNTLQGYDRNGFTAKISRFFGVEEENNAKKALDKTQNDIKSVNTTIDDLNKEISETSLSLNESTKSAKTYSEQISETRSQINSIKKEISDLRSGKVLKDNIAEEIENRTKDLKAAETKLSVLTGKSTPTAKSADTAANKAQQLAEKQIQAELKAEQSRIEIMDEGYAKRKALLELQHKQNIAQINKEEKELEKARRDAGKGELSSKEKSEFNARRTNEDASYSKAQNKLFDGEIEYKKSQYELYFRWVKNMGEDVANNRFKDLLKSGTSYKDYIEKEIQNLTSKKNDGTISEGESNYLINLNTQLDEITGKKSALDTFKESFTQSINRANTLAEKLKVIADYQDKLKNGTSGLVGDDAKASGRLVLSQMKDETDKELNDKLLKEYRTYEEQRKSIQDEYSLLRSQAQKMGDDERLKQINKAEAQELSALNGTFLKQSDSWQKLFQDMDSLTAGEISKLVDDIQNKLSKSDLKLNPVDYKAVIDSLNEAKDKIIEKNPFKALGKFFDDYVEAKKKLAKAKTDALSGKGSQKDVDEAQKEVKTAAKGVTKSIQEVTGIATECGNSLASMFDALGNEDLASGLGTAMDLMGELGNAAASVGKIMSGDIIGGVTGLVSSITSVISIFAKVHDAKYEKKIQNLQKEIDALEQSYSRLERAYNNTYWVFNDAQKSAFEKNVSLINDQIAALKEQARVAARSWDFVRYAQLTKQIQELQAALSKAKEGDDMFGLYEQQKENLRKQQEDIKQQIQAEEAKKKTDKGKISDWEEKIETINQQIEDLDQAMMETLAGTDVQSAIDEFADALVDAYVKGENAADALGEKTKEVLKKAVVEALKRQFLAKAINDAVVYLGSAMKDNELTDEERAKFEAMVNAGGEIFNKALSGIGDWIKDTDTATTEDPTTGAVKSLSEETGGIVAGKLGAVVINQADGISVLRQSLIYHQQTAANTGASAAELKEIKSALNEIKNNGSSLLSKGIS
jgi:tape measure domain-containing protein